MNKTPNIPASAKSAAENPIRRAASSIYCKANNPCYYLSGRGIEAIIRNAMRQVVSERDKSRTALRSIANLSLRNIRAGEKISRMAQIARRALGHEETNNE